jgi:hypothetical protein
VRGEVPEQDERGAEGDEQEHLVVELARARASWIQ